MEIKPFISMVAGWVPEFKLFADYNEFINWSMSWVITGPNRVETIRITIIINTINKIYSKISGRLPVVNFENPNLTK